MNSLSVMKKNMEALTPSKNKMHILDPIIPNTVKSFLKHRLQLYNCAKLLVCTSEVKRERHASHAASVVMAEQKMKAETTLW